MLECEACGEIGAKITDAGIYCEDCLKEAETNLELEENNTHIEDYQGTLPLDIQEKVLRGEYL